MKPEDFNKRVDPQSIKERKFLDNRKFMSGVAGFSSPLIYLSISLFMSILFTKIVNSHFLGLQPDHPPISARLIFTHLTIILSAIFAILISGVYLQGKNKVLEVMRFKNFQISSILKGAGIGLVLILGFSLINLIMFGMGFGVDEGSETTNEAVSAQGFINSVLTILSVCIISPVLEEIFARGAVMGLIENAGGKGYRIAAVIFSSMFFSALHYQGFSTVSDFKTLLVPFMSALVFALIAIKSRSIYPAMAAHVTYNTSIMIVGLLLA